jgi:hypothetical protein
MSHSGQNVIHLQTRARVLIIYPAGTRGGDDSDVPAVKLGRAEHDDPVISCAVALHDLVYDEQSKGHRTKHGQQLECDDRRVCGAPALVGGGIFTPCVAIDAYMGRVDRLASGRSNKGKEEKRTSETKESLNKRGREHVHNSANMPEDVFAVRPKVDRARKEPSRVKWTSASKVCLLHFSWWSWAHVIACIFRRTIIDSASESKKWNTVDQ